MPTKERNWGSEKPRNLPKITQLVNTFKWNIQDSSSLYLKICFSPSIIKKVTYMQYTERRKINPGFNKDEGFED